MRSSLSVTYRNALMYSKTWKLNILPNFFEPVFYLLGLGLGLGFYVKEIGGLPYPVFLAPGLIMIAAMNGASFEASYNVYVRMNYHHTYSAILTTPVSEREIVFGEILWAVIRACLYGGAFFLITFLFGLIPSWTAIGLCILIPLASYLFTTMGMAYSMSIPTIDLFSIYFTLILTPLYIFSDTYFPIMERLPAKMQWLPELTPLFHAVRLTRAFTSGHFSLILIWDFSYILLLGIFFHGLTLRQFRKRLHKPAR